MLFNILLPQKGKFWKKYRKTWHCHCNIETFTLELSYHEKEEEAEEEDYHKQEEEWEKAAKPPTTFFSRASLPFAAIKYTFGYFQILGG